MAKITAKEVNELRKATGAGMMDCKKALVEAEGDINLAVDLLRKAGQKVAAKRGGRDAKEGLVLAKTTDDGKHGALLVVNCETDFVAKNEDFGNFANKILTIAINEQPTDLESLKGLNFGDGQTIAEKIIEQVGVIGEKIDLSAYEMIDAEAVVAYNHPGNKLASMVGLNKSGEAVSDAGRQVAMQIAAMNPLAVDEEGIDSTTVEKELEIGKELAIQEGKPAELAENIAKGRLKKFFKENTLLNQAFVRDNKLTVKQFLKDTESDLTVTEFKRMSLQ